MGAELGLADISFVEEDCCALAQRLGFDKKLVLSVGHAVFVRTGGSPGLVRATLDHLKGAYSALAEEDRARVKPEYFLVSSAYISAMCEMRVFEGLKDLSGEPKAAAHFQLFLIPNADSEAFPHR